MASTYLIRSTPSETFSKLTVSCWFKGMADGTQRNFWGLYDNSDNTRFFGLYYSSNGSLYAYWKQGGEGVQFTLGTMQKFRDPSAWYHFVMTMDTTLATASDRVKFYVNGERVTSFEDSLDTITQSKTCNMMNGTTDGRMQWGGGKISGTQYYWNGLMSHCHMCVGYAYDASSFGSTDSTTGEWKINTSPSVSYGTNGGWWLKDGSQLTDSSNNSNTLTVGGGTLTKTEDCPSNVFATFNPLHFQAGRALTMSNGNGKIASNQNNWQPIGSTLAVPPKTGKWYWEFSQFIEAQTFVGFISSECNININLPYQATDGMITYFYAGRLTNDGSETESYFTAISATTDVVGVALDMTAGTYGQVQFYLNGSPTGSAVALGSSFANQFVMPFAMCNGTGGRSVSINTGNGYFGTTAVSNAGTNASGNGIFEYDVPTGYTALSTKGLNL